jgi:hypothetical protein
VANIVGKTLAGAAFATCATWAAAMPSSAQNLTIQFSGPAIVVDPYNEALAMAMPTVAESVLLEVRYSDATLQFIGEAVDLDPYNEALGTISLSFVKTALLDNPYSAFALIPGDGGPRLWEGFVSFENKKTR